MTHPDTRYRHASGDDEAGCVPCQVDQLLEGAPLADAVGCPAASPDDDEPELCAHCSHAVERVA